MADDSFVTTLTHPSLRTQPRPILTRANQTNVLSTSC